MSICWPAIADYAARGMARSVPLPWRAVDRPAPANATTFLPYDWQALVTRFSFEGRIDYATFTRVRRILEVHLDRLSEARPDLLVSDDERLALYLNAYNAIAVYQVLLHYPVRSIRAIPGAFTRPFPVGHENHSLYTLLHSRIRAFGDPRVHAAVVPATSSAPPLRAYTAAALQQELDRQLRAFLADPRRGLRPMPDGTGVVLSPIFRAFASDFITSGAEPARPGPLPGWLAPRRLLAALSAHAPAELQPLMTRRDARVAFLTYDWTLNDTASTV